VKIASYIIQALLFVAVTANAQIPRRQGGEFPLGGSPTNTNNSSSTNNQSDTKKKSGGRESIIDDSTKNVYGPKTVQYFLESDVFNNRKTLYTLDTNYHDLHRYNILEIADNQYVDLGNLGTSARRLYYRPADQLGAQLGYDSYSPYAYQIADVKYYDTRSPFTNMYLVLGGLGQNILRFDHSRNFGPRLNVGIQVERSTTNKQYGTSGRSDAQSNLIQNWAFVLHSNYRSENGKYEALAQFNYLNHDALEQGGIVPDSSKIKTDGVIFWDNIERSAKLSNASSWERRGQLHLYHQYKMAQGFQLFQILDYRRDSHIFTDRSPADALKYHFYRNTFAPVTFDNQDVRYNLLENKVGIKGRFRDFNYRLHLRQRIYNLAGSSNLPNTIDFFNDRLKLIKSGLGYPQYFALIRNDSTLRYNFSFNDNNEITYAQSRTENFAGIWLNYFLKDSTQRVTAEAEVGTTGLKIKGEIVSNWFEAGGGFISASPTLLQQQFNSNHLRWNNDFKNVVSTNVYGQINLKTKTLIFNPRLDYSLINNYIYYNAKAEPEQYKSDFNFWKISTNLEWRPGRWQVISQLHWANTSKEDIMRLPKLMANLRLSYDFIYSKVLFVQVGTELHYKSRYYADAYMPLTQQFYIQNQIQTDGYLLADVFANFRINRVRLFVKYNNLVRFVSSTFLDSKAGYFSTPYYSGLNETLSFGVNWPLFD
jgi:Putative porin